MNKSDANREDALMISVIQAVADYEGISPQELPPLYEAIDARIFEYLPREATLEFTYTGFAVSIHGDGTVDVQPAIDDSTPHA